MHPRRRLFGTLALTVALLAAARPAIAEVLPRSLAGPLDLFETGLYWLQDQTRDQDVRDPAALMVEIQAVAARQFDFAELALRVGGPRYLRMDLLKRSHYQNRLRDRLFADLAQVSGLYDGLPPHFRLLMPVRLGPWRLMAGVQVLRRGSPARTLYFHFEQREHGWRIVDVSLDGALFSEHLRSQ